jgi:hypothetical protein
MNRHTPYNGTGNDHQTLIRTGIFLLQSGSFVHLIIAISGAMTAGFNIRRRGGNPPSDLQPPKSMGVEQTAKIPLPNKQKFNI